MEATALERMRVIAAELLAGKREPGHAANSIYFVAFESGAFEDPPRCPDEIASIGADFVQMADVIEDYELSPTSRAAWEELIRDAATALLEGSPLPEWSIKSTGAGHQGDAVPVRGELEPRADPTQGQ